jgi:hypothetical protein
MTKKREPQKAIAMARFKAFMEQWPEGPDSIPPGHPDAAYFESIIQARLDRERQEEKFGAMLIVLLAGLPEKRRQAIIDEIEDSMPPEVPRWDWFRYVVNEIDKAETLPDDRAVD